MEAGEPDVFRGPCSFCGETVEGVPYVAFSTTFVGSGDGTGRGFFSKPEDALENYTDWDDVPLVKALHLHCVQTYFEGVHMDLMRSLREQPE